MYLPAEKMYSVSFFLFYLRMPAICTVALFSHSDVLFKTYSIIHTRKDIANALDPDAQLSSGRKCFTLKMPSITKIVFIIQPQDADEYLTCPLENCPLSSPIGVTNANMEKLMMTNVGEQVQLSNNDGCVINIHRVALENVYGPYIRLLESKLTDDQVLARITLPFFPTQQRPFSIHSMELFKQYLYLTVISVTDVPLRDVTLMNLLELALIGQFLEPGCDLQIEALKMISYKLTQTIAYDSYEHLWDTAVACNCLDILHTKARFILPALALHEAKLINGMIGDVKVIIEKYTQRMDEVPRITCN